MSHNLVITNSRESEYVEFDVNVPDGYNKFRVEYLNGSIINQNYLKVGDTLKFTFANHPLRYKIPKMKLKLQYNDAEVDDTVDYTFIDMDMYKYQKLVYLPIYQYFNPDSGAINYIINPCNTDMLYDQPVNNAPSVVINKGDPADPDTFSYVDFSGYYAMGLMDIPSNNIPDLTITIGESIANSRTRPQDMGAFQISNNVVNEVDVNTLTINTYNYGSVWHYPVANQVLKHTESVAYTVNKVIPTSRLVIAYKDEDGDKNTSNISIPRMSTVLKDTGVTRGLLAGSTEVEAYVYLYDGHNTPSPPDADKMIRADTIITSDYFSTYPCIVKKTSDSPLTYVNIPANDEAILGSQFASYGLTEVSGTTHNSWATTTPANYSYIVPEWYYSIKFITIQASIVGTDDVYANWTLNHGGGNDKVLCYHVTPRSTYTQAGIRYTIKFKVAFNNNDDFSNVSTRSYEWLYLCNGLQFDENGEAVIPYRLITNLTPEVTIDIAKDPDGHVPLSILQYADSTCTNNEDLYVEAITDGGEHGLKISANPMKNIIHNITIDVNTDDNTKGDHPYLYSVSNVNADANLKCFIPLKTSNFMKAFTYGSESMGWYVIRDLNGEYSNVVSNKSCEVYIADGHDTLNVEAATDDDAKFKTFNGTLIFDRSNTKITRLFSNDLTGACLGYINDLIAAKMSRVYYACNYKVWNAFLNTNSQLSLSRDVGFLNNIYNKNILYTGAHETYMTSCSDIVKLIGSENVVNNCMPSLYPEEQQMKCYVTYNNEYKSAVPELGDDPPTLYYKFMHYYTSGLLDYPYIGIGTNDATDNSTTVGGVNLMYSPLGDILSTKYKVFSNNANNRITQRPIYVIEKTAVSQPDVYKGVYDELQDINPYYTNSNIQTWGVTQTLPSFRIYRNSNFEQTDLTITTGGLRLLHPIYMQSTPKILTHNILYIFDTVVNNLLSRFNSVMSNDGSTGFLTLLMYTNDDHTHTLPLNHRYTLLRYGTIGIRNSEGGMRYVATSLDSMFLLNYLHVESVNLYQTTSELVSSLPSSPATNEEHIANLITNSIESNVQLFSSKYFNFISNVSQFSIVVFTASYVEQVPYNKEMLRSYWWFSNDTNYNNKILTSIIEVISSYINDTASYNNIKSCKVFICKLGEFLDFPRILYAGCESFNNTMNVSVWNYNMTKYKAPIEVEAIKDGDGRFTNYSQSLKDRSDQKVNTYLYGVMFRYHQLSHGYQNFPNELTNEYLISKALGNRTFKLILYDEYGRRIPNRDTNQGFDNNLYLELALE